MSKFSVFSLFLEKYTFLEKIYRYQNYSSQNFIQNGTNIEYVLVKGNHIAAMQKENKLENTVFFLEFCEIYKGNEGVFDNKILFCEIFCKILQNIATSQ